MATTAPATSTSSGSSGSDTLTATSGGSKISAGAGDDTIIGGAGSDTLNGDAGNDTLVYNISQNVGTQDVYTGGSGIDTLLIQFTLAQWLMVGYQAQIAAYLAQLVAYTNRVTGEVSNGSPSDFTFQFGTSTLKVQMVEKLAVTVDGASVDAADAACIAVADAVTTTEDSGPVTVNVLANDVVPDLVKDLALGTGPSHGTATLVKPNASDPSTWYFQYQANNAYFQSLAVGETATDTFTYSVTDADGDVSTSTVTVTITGSNDGPVIGVADLSGSVTEDGAAITLHDSGTISFDDVDLSDAHTTSVQPVAGNLLGGSLTAVVTTAATGAGAGTVTWDYNVANSATQYLAAGETVVEQFVVKVSDGHGGTAMQTVSVTVTGANDAPTVSSAAATGSLVEDAALPTLATSGTITFDDVDLTDTHTTTVSADSGNKLGGSLTAAITDVATGAGDGTVKWDYSVANSATQYLAAGETTTESFTVKVKDNHGGFVDQVVTVTVTGVNDGPTISAANAAGAVTEDAATPNLTVNGAITFDDVDLTDTHTTTVSADSGNKLGGSLTAAITDVATGAGDGTVKWDYSVANSATQYLAAGETTTESFTVKVKDNHGGFVDQAVTVTVTGVNDAPTIGAADGSGAVTEDATTPNLTDTGAITFDDVDLIDTHSTSVSKDAGNKLGGNLTAAVTDTATGSTDGTVTWDYSVANSATQYLAEGETTTESFTVKVKDNHGGFVDQGVTVTVTGVNDGPTVSAADAAGAVSEDATNPNLTDTGAITFDDIDLIDTHTTSVAADSGNKLGGNLTAGVTDAATGAGDGTVTWDYNVANSATQYLAEGETTTEVFTVKVKDNHGGFVDQGVTVTVTGVNDGPTVSAADSAGAVTEDATAPNLTDTGAITFDDVDLIDTHTTSVSTDSGNKLGGSLTAGVTDVATGAGDGTVTWNYSVANSATQYLAQGETTTEDFTVKVSDNHGGFVDQSVKVTVTGVNDGPTVSAADDSGAVTEDATTPNLTDTGAITFDDVDLIDTHSTSVTTNSGNKLGGNLTAGVTDTATGAGDGTVTWDYSVANSTIQYLAEGETTTEDFIVKVSDNHGGFVDQGVTVTVTGVNDGPTVSTADSAGAVTEDATTPNLTDTGSITFDDVDLIDTHTTSVSTDSGNKLGGNLTASVTDVATGAGDGTVTWDYSVANSATQYLAEGETTTEDFTVKVSDNHGGFVDQGVTVTVTGVNDGPTVSAADDSGAVTEDASTPNLTDTGALTFDDVDLIDTHTTSVAADIANKLGGNLTAGVTDVATGAGDGTVTWDYSVANSATQYLAEGETTTEDFTVKVSDNHGGFVDQGVTVTVTGVNDGPTVSNADSAGSVTEDATTPNLTDTGAITFDDVDLIDTHTTSVAKDSGNKLGGNLTASVTDVATGAGDGTVTWDYSVANSATQYLAEGETTTEDFTVKVSDNHGGFVDQGVTVTVTGVNDGPTVSAADAAGAVTEDASTPNLTDTGAITFDDVDLIDTHSTSVSTDAGNKLGGSLTAGVTDVATGAGDGTVTWDYSVANSAAQYLAEGETTTEDFTVKVSDNHGGFVNQGVTVTVTGVNDGPTVSAADAAGAVTEDATTPNLTDTGAITFDDVDLIDTHSTSVVTDAGNKLGGNLTAGVTDAATGAGDGTVTWDYSVANSATQYLAQGETTTEDFTVKVSDNHGGFVDQGVTVTVTGVNDGPTISAADSGGVVTEDATTPNLTDTGAITFDDVDLIDTHTTSVATDSNNKLGGSLTAGVTDTATGTGDGTVTWDYSVANSATQYLAEGETTTEDFTVKVSDNHGGFVDQGVKVIVTGVNDGPTVSAADDSGAVTEDATTPNLTDTGAITFDDVDLIDAHTTSVATDSNNKLGGSLTAGVTDAATGAGDGTVTWNYSVANSATQYLAEGETTTEDFTVKVSDNHGGFVDQGVTVTVTGVNDGPTVSAADDSGAVTEDATTPNLTDTGAITFDDVDLIDTHTTSVAVDAGNKLGGNLTAGVTDVATGAGDGTVTWDYSVANSATQYLAEGETTTEDFTVKVSDNHGGFVDQGVTVTLTGVNDGPTVSNADSAGSVTEDATTPNLTDTGAITFDDVDLIDTHTTSVATDSNNKLGGSLTAGVTDTATGAGDGTVTWNYSVANSATQYLAEGETTTEDFTVKVSDNHGGFVDQGVTVTVTGVNDGPTVSTADAAGAVTEDATTPNLTDTGAITFDDVDLIDTHSTSVVTGSGNKLGGNLTAGVTDVATGAGDGTVTWDYSVANSATQYLAQGETTTEDFTVKVSDNHGGFVDQGVTVTVTGVNDGPAVSAADAAGAVTEDATNPNLTDTGAITFDDVDLIDTHTTTVSTDSGNKLGGILTAGVTDVATGAGDGTVTWNYNVANSATQYLAEGETTTEDFTVKVSDNHSGFVDQGVTVTVTGVNDGPTVSAADAAGAVTEDASTPNLTDTGAITFDDVDLIDTHTTSVSTDSGNKLGGSLTAGVTDPATGAGDGTVTWDYSVANSATQYLAAGETTTEDFTVKVSDNHGGFVDQGVKVTVTGVNDGPTVSAADDSGAVTEDATTPNLTDTGAITFDDVDLIDTHTTSVAADSGNKLGGNLTAGVTDVATGAGDGTVTWDYSVANSATQYLAEGETTTEDFTVKVSDNHGGFVDQGVTVTVTGVNDGPTVSAADDSGAVTEDASTPNLTDTGAITFDDVDLIDTHTTTVSTDSGNKLGGILTAGVTDVATGAGDGTVTWNYNVANSATQYLAEGETTTEEFTVKVSDNHGGFVDQGVTVTVTGVNDGPTVSAADDSGAVTEDATIPNLTDTGAITFDDVDLIDTHTTSVATDSNNKLGGSLTAGVTNVATGAGDGTVTWDYSVANSATQYLAEGETTTEDFTVKVSDNHGGFVDQGVTVTVTGVNDGPTVSTADAAGAVTEDATTPNLTDTGAITFDDVDLIDTHTTTVSTDSGNKVGGILTAGVTDIATGAGDGTVTWDYSVANSATQYLAEGETTTEDFTVKVSDNHGGFVDQGVTVTVTGVNDGPTVSAADAAGAVTEDATTPNLTDTGAITFDDVDLIDTHTTSVSTDSGNKLGGNLTAGVTDVATGAGDGTVTWDYSVANSATQYLAEGETTTEDFTVKVSDNHGAFVDQGVTVTVTGVNDGPTVSNADSAGSVTEDASTPNLTDTGAITFDDVDLIDTHTTSVTTDSGNKLGGSLNASVTDTATGAGDGTVTWDYSVANSATQYLAAGETTTEDFTVKVSDNHGGSVNQGVTVTVTGVNDGPTVSAADAAGAVTEDATTPNLTDTGAITFDDVDLTDTHSTSVATDAGNKLGGNLTAAVTDTATGTTDGTVTWDYSVLNSATQYLAQGETTKENFTVKVSDNHGGFVDQAVTVTVTGVNDGPTITAADATGAVTEDATTPNLTDTGALTFDDADLIDTHTTSVTTSAANTLGGSLNASVTDTATGVTDGTVTWNYSVANSATQHLAEGEIATENFTVKVKDNNGGAVDQNIAVTVTGVNDGPTINAGGDIGAVTEDASSPTLTSTGALIFDDVDLIDTHTASAAAVAGNTLGGGMTASVTDAATGAGDGTVTWNYSIANSAVQSLAAGQTVTEKFNVTVADGHGGTAVRLVTITVTGTNDAPTISTAVSSGSVTEDSSTPNLSSTGNIAFDDVDLTDTHTTTVTAVAGNPLGGTLTASVSDPATGPGDGAVTWTYTVANSATQSLADGQTVTDSFNVKITDTASGSATQTVNASVTGVNDAPTITAAGTDAQAAVTEDATTPNLSDTGTIAFNDVDLIDVHTTSVIKSSGTLGGTLVMGAVAENATTEAGTVGWTYTVANSAVQQLGKGATATETFTVTVNDGKGGTVSQLVTATVTGTNDAPVVDLNGGGAGNDATAAATEQTTLVMVPAATVTDIDSPNITSLTLTLTARPDGNAVEALSLNAAATAAASGLTVSYTAATGVLSISGSAPKATYQTILDGVQYTNTSDAPSTSARTVNVVANDGTDASVSHSVVVSMTPVNDPPVATITPTTYAATEQVAMTLKNAGLSISDVDAASGSMTVTLSVTEGTLTAVAGGSGATVSNSGTSSMTISGTVTQINNLLNTDATSTVSYIDATDTPGASATLTLKVNDNGNTGGGSLTNSDTATINITATNDAPSGTNKTISVTEDVTYTLADFGFTDVDGNNFAGVVINTLPLATAGVLRLGNTALVAGTFVTAAQISDGMLIYSPADNVIGNAGDTSFTFAVRDDGLAGGGNVNQDPTPNTMTVDMSNTNFTDTSSSSNVTVQLTGANESIEDNGTGNGDSINLNTAAGGATTFTELNFFRSDNNMEMSWTQSGVSRVVTAINQYSPSAYEDFNSFDDGGTYAGYNLGNLLYVLNQGFAGASTNEIFAGTAAAESINGAGGNDLLFGNGGDDTLTGGAGTDLLAGGLGNDTFVFGTGDSVVAIGGSGNAGTITGQDVIADFAAGADSLDLQGSPVAAANGVTDGLNSALTIGGNQVSSHSITNGIVTFDDAAVFAAALSLTSLAQVAAVVQYLRGNDIGAAGATVAFTATIGSLTHAYVYEQISAGAPVTANDSLLVDVVGVSLTNLTDLGLV